MKKRFVKLWTICLSISCLVGCGANSVSTGSEATSSVSAGSETASSVESTSNTSSEGSEEGTEDYYDAVFLEKLSDGLQARWDLTNREEESENGITFEEELTRDEKYVNTELDILGECRDKVFEDPTLQEYAITYTNGLKTQKELVEKALAKEIDEKTFYEKWQDAYTKRGEQIYNIYNDYDLKIDSKYVYNLNMIFNNVYLNRYGISAFVDKLNSSITDGTVVESSNDGLDIIKVTRTNPTEYEFKDLPIYLHIYDGKGTDDYEDDEFKEVLRYTVGSWKPGEEVQLTFKRELPTDEEAPFIFLDLY